MPARLEFSDGTVQSCDVQPIGGKLLTINPSPQKRSLLRKVDYANIMEIRQEVQESLETRPWMYAESGKNVRVEIGEESYPVVNFATTLVLTTGEVITGHIISVAFRCRDVNGSTGKFFIKRQLKGHSGQRADALVFPTAIRFTANAPYDAKAITGRLPSAFGHTQKVVAIDLTRKIIVNAVCSQDGSFAFPALLQGEYELYAQTDKYILAGFPADDGDDVTEGLRTAFSLADDFFNDRVILRRDGDRTLVWKQRAEFHDAEMFLHGGILRHLEVWNWHRAGQEWKLDSRNMPIRLMQQGGEADRKLYFVTKFRAVKPGAEITLSDADLTTAIPYPERKGE